MAQEVHTYTAADGPAAADGRALEYLLFLPATYGQDPAQRWPLILFLHGAGERGSDIALVRKHGIARIADEQAGTFPFVAISPQCPAEHRWTEYVDVLLDIVEQVSAGYAIDRDRVYLTGLSMGGQGTWVVAAAAPERFAAIAPICGPRRPLTDDWEARVRALARTPVWAFHGAQDPVVPLADSEAMVEALRQAGGNARLTVYPEAGHDAWTAAYADPALYAWFLAQRRRASAP